MTKPYEYNRPRIRKTKAQMACFKGAKIMGEKFGNGLVIPSMRPEIGCVAQALREGIIDEDTALLGIEKEYSAPHIKQKLNKMGFRHYDMIKEATENITEKMLDEYMKKLKIHTFEFVYLDLCGEYTAGQENFIKKLKDRVSYCTFFMVNFNGAYRKNFFGSSTSNNIANKCYGKVRPRTYGKAIKIMNSISEIINIKPAWFIRYKEPSENKPKPTPMGISCFSNMMDYHAREEIMKLVDVVQNTGYVGVDHESTTKKSKVLTCN